MPSGQPFYLLSRRLLSCIAAFIMLYIEITGSSATKQTLYGICHTPLCNNIYKSALISTAIAQILTNSTFWPTVIAALPKPQLSILYIDEGMAGSLSISYDSCLEFRPSDLMYNKSYLEPLLHTILDDHRWHNINLSDHYVVVDCQFDGRLFNDTTALKVYLLDPTLANITTIFLQTMLLVRPAIFMTEASGLANVMTAGLNEMTIVEGALRSTQTAQYHHVLSIEFPYAMNSFLPIQLLNPTSSTDGMWEAIILESNEFVKVLGTDGVYRESPQIQGNYDYYNWVLSDNPVNFIEEIVYYAAPCSMDCYAWVRCLLGMGVAFNLGVNVFVALVIVVNSWLCRRQVWVPDFYPSIQRRIQLRSLMLIAVTYSNNWWHVFEYALQKGNARTGWNSGFVMADMIRSDCLTYLLSIALTLADLFHQRLGLDLLMLIYAACWSYQDDLVYLLRWGMTTTDAYLAANYIECIVAEEGNPMTLWVYHENLTTPIFLIMTEFAWFFVAISITILYIIIVVCIDRKSTTHIDIRISKMSKRLQSRSIRVLASNSSFSENMSAPIVQHWTKRSSLYEIIEPIAPDSTTFEIGSMQLLATTYGLIAPFDAYEIRDECSYISPSAIWLLGFFVLKNKYVVEIRDYVKLWVNSIMRLQIFRVYIFSINEQHTITQFKQMLAMEDINISDLIFQISLRPLR